jgi:digeranylgeranylglycerophospholipid reductase
LESFDLIIVGAGPAGCAAAYTAANEGISVLLLEEHPQIGVPVICAEGISRSTIKPYLDIKREWVSRDLDGAIIRGPFGDEFQIEYPGCGWVLDRRKFDRALADMAQKRGAAIKTSAKAVGIKDNKVIVEQKGKKENYQFKFIIGADGIASRVGSWFGIDTRLGLIDMAVCAQYLIENITASERYASLIFGHKYAPGGYAWIFPKSKTSANIGLGLSPIKTKKKAKAILDDWIKMEFPDGVIKRRIFGGVPSMVFKNISGKNFFLVGDAARLSDPLSGAGITNGIKSGVIAGHNAMRRIKGQKDTYYAEIKKEILNEIKFHLKVRNVYWRLDDDEYNQIFKIGKKVFDGKTVDDINIRNLVKEILMLSPKIMLKWFGLIF